MPAPNPTLAHLAAALSEDDARELVRIFLQEFPSLHGMLASGDRRQCYLAAHSLKSSAQHMGLFALADRLAALESHLEEPGSAVTPEDLKGVERDFAQEAESLRTFAAE